MKRFQKKKVMNSVDKIVDKKTGLFVVFQIINLTLLDKMNVK